MVTSSGTVEFELDVVRPSIEREGSRGDAFLFWRSVRQLGRRPDLGLDRDEALRAFWSADKAVLTQSAEKLLRDRLADRLRHHLEAGYRDLGTPGGPDTDTGGDAPAAPVRLLSIAYAPFRLRLCFDRLDRVRSGGLDLFGFSLVASQSLAETMEDVFGIGVAPAMRVTAFVPDAATLAVFGRCVGERAAERPTAGRDNRKVVLTWPLAVVIVAAVGLGLYLLFDMNARHADLMADRLRLIERLEQLERGEPPRRAGSGQVATQPPSPKPDSTGPADTPNIRYPPHRPGSDAPATHDD